MKTHVVILSSALLCAGQALAQQASDAGKSESAAPSTAASSEATSTSSGSTSAAGSDTSKASTSAAAASESKEPSTSAGAASESKTAAKSAPAASAEQAASTGATRSEAASADSTSGPAKSDMAALTTQEFVTEQQEGQLVSDSLIGRAVVGPDGREIGGIDALILDASGKVVAAVVGVGGFLGIGDKPVALPWEGLTITTDVRGKQSILAAVTKEQLESAPRFQTLAERRQAANREAVRVPEQAPPAATDSAATAPESKPKTQ